MTRYNVFDALREAKEKSEMWPIVVFSFEGRGGGDPTKIAQNTAVVMKSLACDHGVAICIAEFSESHYVPQNLDPRARFLHVPDLTGEEMRTMLVKRLGEEDASGLPGAVYFDTFCRRISVTPQNLKNRLPRSEEELEAFASHFETLARLSLKCFSADELEDVRSLCAAEYDEGDVCPNIDIRGPPQDMTTLLVTTRRGVPVSYFRTKEAHRECQKWFEKEAAKW
eukprot:TRINITY_DN313_c0_g4_i2.p1 TRINITY_DN313_c0_g4~~TRINITY_DN313_c0_g4_i2.p1  ORF type:complete len:225 (+),score=38.43 TRINITY_DN313_c0_g4_i2:141-815(+)